MCRTFGVVYYNYGCMWRHPTDSITKSWWNHQMHINVRSILHHHHHHHISFMELGHLLTRSGLTWVSYITLNKCRTRCNYTQFILSVNCSTCFEWSLHSSSGTQTTVSTASGTGQSLLLSWRRWDCRLNSPMIATDNNNGWPVPDAVDTVICAPDDEWRDHLKHVEQFTDKINCVLLHFVGHLLT